MSKTTESEDMREQYDFSKGVRGKHYRAFAAGSNVVVLDPDVARIFRDAVAVNDALRMLMQIAGKEVSDAERR